MILLLFIILSFIVVWFPQSIQSLGVYNGHISGALTYCFAHVGFLHWALNSFSLILLFRPIYNRYCTMFGFTHQRTFFIYCYAASVISGMIASASVPTVGASGIVFYLMGMLLAMNPTKKQFRAYSYAAIAVGLQIVFGKSNVLLHLVAFSIGILHILVMKLYDND